MAEFARKIPMVPMAANPCAAIAVSRRSRPRSRNVASASSIGVAMSSAKHASKMSNLRCVNNYYYCRIKPPFSIVRNSIISIPLLDEHAVRRNYQLVDDTAK